MSSKSKNRTKTQNIGSLTRDRYKTNFLSVIYLLTLKHLHYMDNSKSKRNESRSVYIHEFMLKLNELCLNVYIHAHLLAAMQGILIIFLKKLNGKLVV